MKVANGNCVAAKSRHQHVQDRTERHLVHKYERMTTNTKEHEQKKEIIFVFEFNNSRKEKVRENRT